MHRQARRLHIKTSLASLFLRDGTVYFLVLLIVNISQLAVFELTGLPYISIFLTSATAILISRFIMNLRQANDKQSYDESAALAFSAPAFRAGSSFIGELGAPLDYTGGSLFYDDDGGLDSRGDSPGDEDEGDQTLHEA
ncbi:hypothetical protein PsYK624_052390 [Phanerochaete sordida]|uniref:Uncharacterized protein n=1 Tax=Phanerochaete sordida TaxID=48140 RepID=A0A9P3G803_9APHY|nr:hypothetical protein PsYK624_052390 [Phanerochaete sordida]